ncbi:hypothetical protein M3Y94_01011100 [Aphelenchoides besseyi]|nr:hypothetical protein M3Y94_01011100 [Aphelenchoides besseyi]
MEGSNTTLLDPTCAGGSATLVVEKDKPWVVDFKPDQKTGGQNQLLTFIFGGCLVKASYGMTSPLTFKIGDDYLDLPASLTVQADKVVAKGANNKEVDVSCAPKIESAGDGSGRSKITTNYSAADPANAKGFSAVYNAPIFVPKETESAYTSTWAIVGYCVIGVAAVVVLGILVYCFFYKPRNNPQANVDAGQGASPGVVSLPPAGQNLAAKTPNKPVTPAKNEKEVGKEVGNNQNAPQVQSVTAKDISKDSSPNPQQNNDGLQPRVFVLDQKAQHIHDTKEKRASNAYPTMDDIKSDWTTQAEKAKSKGVKGKSTAQK